MKPMNMYKSARTGIDFLKFGTFGLNPPSKSDYYTSSLFQIAKDAKECVQECVSEFISFITSEASGLLFRAKL